MSDNNEFTGRTKVYLSYEKKEVEIIENRKYVLKEKNTNKKHKKPKAIQEVEKLIATLEAEGGEAVKPLIEKKQAEIYELEAKYNFAKLVLSKMEQDEDGVMIFRFTFHKNGQRYYAEGTFYDFFGFWLGIILESNEPQNGKVIKGGSIVLRNVLEERLSNTMFGTIDSKSFDKDMSIDAVLQTIDGEIVTICQTLYKN